MWLSSKIIITTIFVSFRIRSDYFWRLGSRVGPRLLTLGLCHLWTDWRWQLWHWHISRWYNSRKVEFPCGTVNPILLIFIYCNIGQLNKREKQFYIIGNLLQTVQDNFINYYTPSFFRFGFNHFIWKLNRGFSKFATNLQLFVYK